NIGPNAGARLQGNITDGDETIHIKTTSSNTVVVWSDQFNVDEFSATTNPFVNVDKIVINGGAGGDTIDLSGVQAGHGVYAEVRGGEGNDVITGGGGNDFLYGDAGNDIIDGGAGNDEIYGGLGDDPKLEGGLGADTIYGDEGDDKIWGHYDVVPPADDNEQDILDGGLGDDTIYRSGGNDIVDLESAGSFDLIDGSSGSPILDFSDKAVSVTFFVQGDKILIGFGEQKETTAIILGTNFSFSSLLDLETNYDFFDSVIGVTNATGVSKLIGGDEADTFYVQETASALTLDGGIGPDVFYFFADPSGVKPITVTVNDVGEKLKDENVINVIGSSGADGIFLTDSTITLDNNDTTVDQVVTYVPPDFDVNNLDLYTDQLIIRVYGDNTDATIGGSTSSGDGDQITVESTAPSVPVRVEGGPGDDTVIVGSANGTYKGVDGIQAFLNPNANEGMGLGPLTLVGGFFDIDESEYVDTGHDVVIVDDSQDDNILADEPQAPGNLNAFMEKREGLDPIEVGMVSGLEMVMYQLDDNNTPENLDDDSIYETHGRVEFEGFEAVDVRLSDDNDTFTIGGEFDLDKLSNSAGKPDADLLVTTELPVNRLVSPAQVLIEEGTKGDDSPATNEVQKILVENASGGTYTLTFDGQETDPIAFDATAAQLESRLNDLSTITDVSVVRIELPEGFNYAVTFNNPGSTDVSMLEADYALLETDPFAVGIYDIVHTFSGMSLVHGNLGDDEFRVLQTNDLEQADAIDGPSEVLSITTVDGEKGLTSEVVTLDIKSEVGYFVLEFDSGSDDTVPGAEQSVALRFDNPDLQDVDQIDGTFTTGNDVLRNALEDMRLVGSGFVDKVEEVTPSTGAYRTFEITFDNQLGDLPDLRAYTTQLLISGSTDEDTFNVQSIDQPTYLLGGDDSDYINLNVAIDAGGADYVKPPDPLFENIPAQATSNGINDLLTADGQRQGDAYINYLFGGTINSQINLFDSGDALSGTDYDDLFLMRAAVAADGLAFVALLKHAKIETVIDGYGEGNEIQSLTVQPGG
ncbi:MAG: hypothetical protein ACYS21_08150, partial [Planctomycetota bacterium]